LDVELSATFERDGRQHHVQGFYDGEGVYRIRFMPDALGAWTYATQSNEKRLDGKSGKIEATPPSSMGLCTFTTPIILRTPTARRTGRWEPPATHGSIRATLSNSKR
jgi:hypothetical protein